MSSSTIQQGSTAYPPLLAHTSPPPRQLHVLGDGTLLTQGIRLAVIGSRKVSPYGKAVTTKLAQEAAKQGIIIVSGLALGVDGLAHRAALDVGGKTIAVLPCGLDRIYPSSHKQLAEQILKQGGALITEYSPGTEIFKTNFIARNRIISGISEGVLITEAAAKSGTIHTANFALEQGRTVMAVPGNITSLLSEGTNNLIKAGAQPVTCVEDICAALDVQPAIQTALPLAANEREAIVLQLIAEGVTDSSELLHRCRLDAALYSQTLTMLEITGKIRAIGAGHWAIA